MRLPRLRFVRDAPEDRTLTAATVPPVMLSGALPGGARVNPANALDQVSDAYACVRALADAAASLPLHCYSRSPDGSRTRVEGRTAELLRSPGLGQTTPTLVGQIMTSLQLHGNAAIAKYRGRGGERVEQLGVWPWERCSPEIRAGRVVFTLTDSEGRRSEHDERDVLHIRSAVSVDGLTGLSPVAQCRMTLALGANLTRSALSFFANDSTPRGLLKVPSRELALDRENDRLPGDVGSLRAQWEASNRGPAQQHRIAILAGDCDFLPIQMPAADAQMLESRQFSATEIARLFRVPPWVVGAPAADSVTYSNTEQQSLHFVTYSLRPWLVLIEKAISQDDDLVPGPQYVEFELDGLLRADAATRAQVYTAALHPETGWLEREEVRRMENLPPEQSPPTPPQAARPPEPAIATNGSSNKEREHERPTNSR